MALKLLGICGSLRKASVNRKLLDAAARAFGDAEYALADLRLPLYDGDLEAQGLPEGVLQLQRQIAQADAVVMTCPEYNSGVPGVLKNALDWVSRGEAKPWPGKPVALMHAAAGRTGGARANFALRLVMAPFRAHVLAGPEVLVAAASKAFDDTGDLIDTRYRDALAELMADLRAAAER